MRVLWFGSYSKGPGYPRSETLIAGLRELGHDVVEVHVPLFDGAPDRVALGAGRGAARLAWRQAMAAVRLAARYFRAGDHAARRQAGFVPALRGHGRHATRRRRQERVLHGGRPLS